MDNEISVQVIGKCGSGKTTILQEIGQVLSKHGLKVEWNNTDDINGGIKNPDEQLVRVEALKNKNTKITLSEVQSKRIFN